MIVSVLSTIVTVFGLFVALNECTGIRCRQIFFACVRDAAGLVDVSAAVAQQLKIPN